LTVAVVVAASNLFAAEPAIVYRGATIHIATGKTFPHGTLIVRGGKILAVGAENAVRIPAGTKIVDVAGMVIIPGLVGTQLHLGVYSRPQVKANGDGNEMTGAVQGIVRAINSLNPFDPGIRMANAGGVTTANIMPGSGNVIGARTIYVRLGGRTVDEMHIKSPVVLGGLKMADGENPKRSYGTKGQAPATRMKVAALQRAQFVFHSYG
jgi:imidazolonepropionase-like amidohydrolase